MPRISYFYGIVITMYYNDHAPPHLHALYGDDEAKFLVPSGELFAGSLPRRAKKLVQKWVALHPNELVADWEKAREGLPLDTIEPLP